MDMNFQLENDNNEDNDDDHIMREPSQWATQAAAAIIKNKNKCPSLEDLKAEFAALNITDTFVIKTKTHYNKIRLDTKHYNNLKWTNFLYDGRLQEVEYHERNRVYIPIGNSEAHLRMNQKTVSEFAHKISATEDFGWLCGYDKKKELYGSSKQNRKEQQQHMLFGTIIMTMRSTTRFFQSHRKKVWL